MLRDQPQKDLIDAQRAENDSASGAEKNLSPRKPTFNNRHSHIGLVTVLDDDFNPATVNQNEVEKSAILPEVRVLQ